MKLVVALALLALAFSDALRMPLAHAGVQVPRSAPPVALLEGGGSAVAGGASTAFKIGAASGTSTAGKAASGMAAVGQAGVSTAINPLKRAVGDSYRSGSRAAFEATGGKFSNSPSSMPTPANDGPPAWARRMKRQQSLHHGTAVAAHAIRSGDGGSAGTAISLSERS